MKITFKVAIATQLQAIYDILGGSGKFFLKL